MMMMVKVAAVAAICAALVGCVQSERPVLDKPVAEMTQAEWCAKAFEVSGSRRLTAVQQALLYDAIRKRGCI